MSFISCGMEYCEILWLFLGESGKWFWYLWPCYVVTRHSSTFLKYFSNIHYYCANMTYLNRLYFRKYIHISNLVQIQFVCRSEILVPYTVLCCVHEKANETSRNRWVSFLFILFTISYAQWHNIGITKTLTHCSQCFYYCHFFSLIC